MWKLHFEKWNWGGRVLCICPSKRLYILGRRMSWEIYRHPNQFIYPAFRSQPVEYPDTVPVRKAVCFYLQKCNVRIEENMSLRLKENQATINREITETATVEYNFF